MMACICQATAYPTAMISLNGCATTILTFTVGERVVSSPCPAGWNPKTRHARAAGPIGIRGAICLDFGGGYQGRTAQLAMGRKSGAIQ